MTETIYLIYQTTNLVNGKTYIGQHKTTNIEDGYLGSGQNIKRAIKKYDKENFKREILFTFDNFDDMNAKEAELVTEEFIALDTNYNLQTGGIAGAVSDETKAKISKARSQQIFSLESLEKRRKSLTGLTRSPEIRKKMSKAQQNRSDETRDKMSLSKQNMSQEFREKMSEIAKNRSLGTRAKISERMKNHPDVICPHCHKVGKGPAMKRWHFNNCRLNQNAQYIILAHDATITLINFNFDTT